MWDFRVYLTSILWYSDKTVTCHISCYFRKDKMRRIKNLIYAFFMLQLIYFNYNNRQILIIIALSRFREI